MIRKVMVLATLLALAACETLYEEGGDWECKYGSRKNENNVCAPIKVPDNAWIDGRDWACNDGYKKEGDQCVELEMMENAWFDGADWHCNDGYIMEGEQCEVFVYPENATLEHDYTWTCNEGYVEKDDDCVPATD